AGSAYGAASSTDALARRRPANPYLEEVSSRIAGRWSERRGIRRRRCSHPGRDTPMTQTQIVRRWFDELWNEGQEAVIDELLAPGMVARGLAATDIVGRDQFRQFYQAFRSAFSDVHITLDNVIEAGDFVTCLARVDLVPRNGQGPVQICGS